MYEQIQKCHKGVWERGGSPEVEIAKARSLPQGDFLPSVILYSNLRDMRIKVKQSSGGDSDKETAQPEGGAGEKEHRVGNTASEKNRQTDGDRNRLTDVKMETESEVMSHIQERGDVFKRGNSRLRSLFNENTLYR